MTIFESIFLAIIQGLTEFLPVSSSGHLVLFQKIFGITTPPVFFDVLLHLGTLCAILIFFQKEIISLFKDWKNNIDVWLLLIIGSIPAGIFGLFLSSRLEKIFNSLSLVGTAWIVSGILLLLTKRFSSRIEKLNDIKKSDALIIGLFQAISLFPGVSRSGATISGGMFRKLSPQTALTYSFLLSIPAILGATFMELKDASITQMNTLIILIPVIIAGLVGFFSLKILKSFLISRKFYVFGYYCLFLGALVLVFSK